MHFDMKRPCDACPFVPGSSTNTTLYKERIESIVDGVNIGNTTFACHKHLDKEKIDWQHCAGALIHVEKSNSSNDMLQLAERLGIYDPSRLDMSAEVLPVYKREE